MKTTWLITLLSCISLCLSATTQAVDNAPPEVTSDELVTDQTIDSNDVIESDSSTDNAPQTTEAADSRETIEPESTSNASPEPPLTTPEDLTGIRYSCAQQGLTRRIEVYYLNAPEAVPCEVNYYKDSEVPDTKQTLWQAQSSQGYCEDKAQGFVAKLSNWGWDCNKN
jgi:hypothetical protein